jgi:hypothetical protein
MHIRFSNTKGYGLVSFFFFFYVIYHAWPCQLRPCMLTACSAIKKCSSNVLSALQKHPSTQGSNVTNQRWLFGNI